MNCDTRQFNQSRRTREMIGEKGTDTEEETGLERIRRSERQGTRTLLGGNHHHAQTGRLTRTGIDAAVALQRPVRLGRVAHTRIRIDVREATSSGAASDVKVVGGGCLPVLNAVRIERRMVAADAYPFPGIFVVRFRAGYYVLRETLFYVFWMDMHALALVRAFEQVETR